MTLSQCRQGIPFQVCEVSRTVKADPIPGRSAVFSTDQP